jgi:hypothetical protein
VNVLEGHNALNLHLERSVVESYLSALAAGWTSVSVGPSRDYALDGNDRGHTIGQECHPLLMTVPDLAKIGTGVMMEWLRLTAAAIATLFFRLIGCRSLTLSFVLDALSRNENRAAEARLALYG